MYEWENELNIFLYIKSTNLLELLLYKWWGTEVKKLFLFSNAVYDSAF